MNYYCYDGININRGLRNDSALQKLGEPSIFIVLEQVDSR